MMVVLEDELRPKEGYKEFDPLKDLFSAQAEKPSKLGKVNLRALTPFQRALLVIDGTVTKFIESYTMEPVEVIRLNQTERSLPEDHIWLEALKGERVVAREVLLIGRYSRTVYAYALSLTLPSRLGEDAQKGLDIEGEGLGRLLNKDRKETYRDILWYGKECLESLPVSIPDLSREFLSRTYRIFADGKPVMLINEKFPIGRRDRLPAHH